MSTFFLRLSLAVLFLAGAVHASAQSAAPTPGSSEAARATRVSTASDYKLVVGDKLRIEVYKDPQLSQSLQIRPDGKITLPLIGDVTAAGQTSATLRDAITASLKEYVTNPVVTVIVVETEPPTITVMGEVNTPGTQPMKGALSVLQALAAAGGFKDFANTRNIQIRRTTATGVQTIKFDYKDAVKNGGQPVYLRPGDLVIVP
jgi:polysaccharide biosynthesis/export protein